MNVTCPSCKQPTEVADDAHYAIVECPACGARFQAVTDATQQVSREFIDELLKSGIADPEPSDD